MRRSLSRMGWGMALLSFLSICIAIGLIFGTYQFTLTEDQIREKLSEVLPIEKNGVLITNIGVDLSAVDSNVAISVVGSAARLKRTFGFELSAVGIPEYEFLTGEFYFRPTEVKIVSLKQTGGDTVAESISKATDLAKKLFPERNKIIDEGAHAALEIGPEVQVWLEKGAEMATVTVLKQSPVYRLPNTAKGIAAQAVLDDIKVDNQKVVINLSLYRLSIWVLLFGFSALLFVGILMSGYAPLFIGIGALS